VEGAARFQDVKAWQLAHEFVLFAYRLSVRFPSHETFGLLLAHDLNYSEVTEANELLEHTSRLLNRYTAAVTAHMHRT